MLHKTLIFLAAVLLMLPQGSETQRERHFHLADIHIAQVRSVPMPLLVREAHLMSAQYQAAGLTTGSSRVPTQWPEPTTKEPHWHKPTIVPVTKSTNVQTAPSTGYGKWGPILQCESNGNWQANTGNGYYGGLQFSLRSWQWVGGSGYPHEATPQEQILRAEKLLALQGWQAWPACSLKVGYR